MLNGDLLIHSKQLYNCKWYKRLYYKFYNFWQLLNIFNKPYITIYLCFKEDDHLVCFMLRIFQLL